MSARECPGCAGTGRCHTFIMREKCGCNEKCEDCDGTGKVWPSVEYEQSLEFDGLNMSDDDKSCLETAIYEVAIEGSFGSRVRILVQRI